MGNKVKKKNRKLWKRIDCLLGAFLPSKMVSALKVPKKIFKVPMNSKIYNLTKRNIHNIILMQEGLKEALNPFRFLKRML